MIVHRAQAVIVLGRERMAARSDDERLRSLWNYVDGISTGLSNREHATVDRLAAALGLDKDAVSREAESIRAGHERGLACLAAHMQDPKDTCPAMRRGSRSRLGRPADRCQDLVNTTTHTVASPPIGRQVNYCG